MAARRREEVNILRYAAEGKDAIDARLRELDQEWDIERAMEVNASLFSIGGIALSFVSGKKWLLFPLLAAGFLLQQATQGWSYPVVLFRRLGMRYRSEIDRERCAIKAIRGDFENLPKIDTGVYARVRDLLDSIEK